MKEARSCNYCGNAFERKSWHTNTRWSTAQFCSRDCQRRAKRTLGVPRQKECVLCGVTFFRGIRSSLSWEKATCCSKQCLGMAQRGTANPSYKGGHTRPTGYRIIYVDGKQMLEHRFVMSQHLGRPLLTEEVVHHIDGNPANNVLSNLQLLPDNGEHTHGEKSGRARWTAEKVRKVRAMRQTGLLYREISEVTGIPMGTVSAILSRRRWGHLQ